MSGLNPPKPDQGDYAHALHEYHRSLQAHILESIWTPLSPPKPVRRRSNSNPEARSRSGSGAGVGKGRGEGGMGVGVGVDQRRPSHGGDTFSFRERLARKAEGDAVKALRRRGFRRDSSQDDIEKENENENGVKNGNDNGNGNEGYVYKKTLSDGVNGALGRREPERQERGRAGRVLRDDLQNVGKQSNTSTRSRSRSTSIRYLPELASSRPPSTEPWVARPDADAEAEAEAEADIRSVASVTLSTPSTSSPSSGPDSNLDSPLSSSSFQEDVNHRDGSTVSVSVQGASPAANSDSRVRTRDRLPDPLQTSTSTSTLPLPLFRPTQFDRTNTCQSIITIRSSSSPGDISDSDESFTGLAPSPMWSPRNSGQQFLRASKADLLFGGNAKPSASPLRHETDEPTATAPATADASTTTTNTNTTTMTNTAVTTETKSTTNTNNTTKLEPAEIAEIRQSLAMKTIVTPAAAPAHAPARTPVQTPFSDPITPACEPPAEFASNPTAPHVSYIAAKATTSTFETSHFKMNVARADVTTTTASGPASNGGINDNPGPGRFVRRWTFQRPHHKNGQGKGRGGDWVQEA